MTDYTKLVHDIRAIADELDCKYCGIKGISGGCKSCVLYDAADAIEALDAKADYWMGQAQEEYEKRLRQMPKRGEWITIRLNNGGSYTGCSCCEAPIPTDTMLDYIPESESKYCYSCGAKMDGEVEHG